MKIISNAKWEEYQILKRRDWKEYRRLSEIEMKNTMKSRDYVTRIQQYHGAELSRLETVYENDTEILKLQIKEQRKTITKQHIDIDKLQKLLKRKKK